MAEAKPEHDIPAPPAATPRATRRVNCTASG